jgi:hypothetical protein
MGRASNCRLLAVLLLAAGLVVMTEGPASPTIANSCVVQRAFDGRYSQEYGSFNSLAYRSLDGAWHSTANTVVDDDACGYHDTLK